MTLQTLYARRDVLNWPEIEEWAKQQGFTSTLGAEMHVTIVFSKTAFDVDQIERKTDTVTNSTSSTRKVKPLGDKGAVVLSFSDSGLQQRWQEILDAGASFDFETYQPHVTISYDAGGIDLDEIEPYEGKIELGPEIFEPIDEEWADKIEEKTVSKIYKSSKILKVDTDMGLVFGYGLICKVNGEDYYDLQDQNVTEEAMLDAALDFSLNSNQALDMHGQAKNGMKKVGGYPFLFPLTTEIAKQMGIETELTGLMVGFHTKDQAILQKFRDKEYTGFSIGGYEIEVEDI